MNKKFIAISTLLLTVLSACQNAPKPAQAPSETSQTAAPQPKPKAKLNIKRTHVPIASDFQNIISIGGVNIVYTQGDRYDIEVEGDSVLLPHVGIDIESGVLTLKVNADSNKDINLYESNYGLTAYITAPGLHCVSLCESGNFTCTGKWESPDIHIGCMSTGRFDVNEIVCETFKYESSDYDKSAFRLIKAQTASIFGYRKCYGTFHVDVDHLELICEGTSNMTIMGQAHTKAIEKHGKAVLNDECKEV